MALPRIRKDFKLILCESANAILFKDFDGLEYWIPKSICTLIKQKKDVVIVTLAVFKFEEITNVKVEPLTDSFISIEGKVLPQHSLDISLIESEIFPLLENQRKQLNICVKSRYVFLNWEAGAGKTLAALTLSNSYLSAGIIDKIVILCPASLQSQWKIKSKEYFPNLEVNIFSVESNSFEKSFEKTKNKIKAIEGNIHLILDESHLIKNIGANRTKNIEKSYKAKCVTCLTATPIGRNASDLFYQYALADRQIIGCENYNSFAKKFLLLGGNDGEKIVAYQNTKELSERISGYSFYLSKKDIDANMPQKHYKKIHFEMNDNQKQAYKFVMRLLYDLQSKSKNNFLSKERTYQITSFLQKISCGFIPDTNEIETIFSNLGSLGEAADNVAMIKNITFSDSNERVMQVLDLLKQIGNEQVIIWCSYIEEVNSYLKVLPNSMSFIGGMSQKEITTKLLDFKNGKFQYLIATQQMGTGFDLPFINHAIYSTTIFDYIKRIQSEDRIYRINRKSDCYIYDIIAKNSIDERIQKILQYKQEIANIFEV